MSTQASTPRLTKSIAAALVVIAVFALSNAATPFYVQWQGAWGFSSGTLTIVFATYIAGLIGALLFAGRIADRKGRKVVLIPGLALSVASSLIFLTADNVLALLFARLFAGIAVGSIVTAGMAAVVDLAPEHRKRAASLIASAAMVLGAGLGPLLAGAAIRFTTTPQPLVFGALAITSAIALAIAWSLPLQPPANPSTSRWRFPAPPAENRREVSWGIATFAPGITATSFVLSLGPSVLSKILHQSDALLAGLTACCMFLAATGIQFALAKLSTRGHLLLSSSAALASMLLLIATASGAGTPALFFASALLAGIAQGLGQLAGLTLIATNVPSSHRAESNAALNIAGYIPAALLPVLTGYLADQTGLPAAVNTFAVILIATAAIALVTVRISSKALATTNAEEKEPAKA